ncbi:hypothetical protein TcarDRAFT_2321 [Thermosinus carboxydivorans Nor1]|uniref:Uncharacterized protein n=1 Tax=Thermosinus carboxydivorans Nor1 TaxID=401526 RepID=A1HNL2_9FIRM|nr:hypothetical protein [Thermosinus carboxydivorans]EAX48371.1 hypothetical protein TcarDRAFT_2321 [Thermosinus carboxydivorans Nor1]
MSLLSPIGSSKTASKWLAIIYTGAAVILAASLVLLSTASFHHIDLGWLLLVVAAVLFLPGVNLMNKDKFRKIDFMDQYIFPYQYGVLMLARLAPAICRGR